MAILKRWDHTTICSNLGHVLSHQRDLLLALMDQLRTHADVRKSSASQLLAKTQESVVQILEVARLLHDVGTNVYPIQGIEGWMLDGDCPSVQQTFAEGSKRERMGMLLLAAVRKVEADHLGAALQVLEKTSTPAGEFAKDSMGFGVMASEMLKDLERLLAGCPLNRIDWPKHGLGEHLDEDTAHQVEHHFGRCACVPLVLVPPAKAPGYAKAPIEKHVKTKPAKKISAKRAGFERKRLKKELEQQEQDSRMRERDE